MDVLVDTSVWSVALRRKAKSEYLFNKTIISSLENLAEKGSVVLIGAVRQEVLSGIKNNEQFIKLKNVMKSFPDLSLGSDHYELAAHFFNKCRRRGIQGSNTDFLICAAAIFFSLPIFTTDKDFQYFQKVLPIKLYQID